MPIHSQTVRFKSLTTENGLSNDDVNTLIQDHKGYIWFGTEDGLNRYDGYNFKIYRNNPNDSNSLSNNVVWSILEDSKGFIWIGTVDGILNQYDPKSNQFYRWDFAFEDKKYSSVTALFEDTKGNIWIGTRLKGIYKLNPDTKEINNYNWVKNDPKSLSHPTVRTINEDNDHNIIVGTYRGLNKFNPDNIEKGFQSFFYEKDNQNSLSSNQIYNLSRSISDPNTFWVGSPDGLTKYNSSTDSFKRIEIPNPLRLQFGFGASTVIEEVVDNEKILWIDTYSGLVRMNLDSDESIRFTHNEHNQYSIVDNRINKILKDQSGVIWIVTENGISYLTKKSLKFNSVFSNNFNTIFNLLEKDKNLTAIHKNDKGDIWLGYSDCIIKLNSTGSNNHIINSEKIEGFNTWSIAEENDKYLWIGTYGQGLVRYDINSSKTKYWELKFKKSGSIAVKFIKSLFIDSGQNLWIGYWGSGLGKIDLRSGNYDLWTNQKGNFASLSYTDVWSINEDKFGRIWIATVGGGLNLCVDEDKGLFKNWQNTDFNNTSLSSNNIYTICESQNSNLTNPSETLLWLGTSNGINKFLIKNKSDSSDKYILDVEVEFYTSDDGLADNSVHSILEDENGNLWLGTSAGISFFDVKEKSFINFNTNDGLIGKANNPGSAIRLDNGLMLFGSKKGLNIFNPANIKLSDFEPPVILTDLKFLNESVFAIDDSVLRNNFINSREIIIPNNKDVLSFEFAALDYNSSETLQYAYKLVGFDKDWILSGSRRFATYTNLDPGPYTFMVKATNADGVWNNTYTKLNLIINPPWWQTQWAYISYAFLIVLGLLLIRRFEINREKLRNELKMKQFEAEQKTKLEEIKSRFFANLSHEFRTPLMLIKGPVEQLKDEGNNCNSNENLELIERNIGKLELLINQLLELSQLEKAAIPLRAKKEDVVLIVKGLVSSFDYLAKQKNISLKFKSNSVSAYCWIDRDKTEKIINNILSNAFKFTPEGGIIDVEVNEKLIEDKLFTEIIIIDTGIGIPENKLDKIFDRFFQMDNSSKRVNSGSGIGLALTKELVDLHKWNISVNSKENKGTEFLIKIPMWDDYLEEKQKIKSDFQNSECETESIKDTDNIIDKTVNPNITKTNLIPKNLTATILIVDDSEDVRKYLTGLLENNFSILQAADGNEGINTAKENMPDLIISDVMMPSMDGIEFCKIIKSEWQTSDIPVILLTAKASFESRIEGLEIGADDYLTKPFDSKELFTRIKNLLEQRKRIRDKYNKEPDPITEIDNLNEADQDFLNKFLELIEHNLDKTNFGTEQLARELFVSRTQLHRKVLAITGQAPGEFIRLIKLKRAAKLLLDRKLSVTQVAYEIGFSSPAQFTRAFSKQFNCLPSEYPSLNKR